MKAFPARTPGELEERPCEQQWPVDTLRSDQAVSTGGGEPTTNDR